MAIKPALLPLLLFLDIFNHVLLACRAKMRALFTPVNFTSSYTLYNRKAGKSIVIKNFNICLHFYYTPHNIPHLFNYYARLKDRQPPYQSNKNADFFCRKFASVARIVPQHIAVFMHDVIQKSFAPIINIRVGFFKIASVPRVGHIAGTRGKGTQFEYFIAELSARKV